MQTFELVLYTKLSWLQKHIGHFHDTLCCSFLFCDLRKWVGKAWAWVDDEITFSPCLFLMLLVSSGIVLEWLTHYLHFLPCTANIYLLWSLWSSRVKSNPLLFVLVFENFIACQPRNSSHSLTDRWSDLISSLFNKDLLVTYLCETVCLNRDDVTGILPCLHLTSLNWFKSERLVIDMTFFLIMQNTKKDV